MKTLLILRHAKSSWKDPSLTDHDRPLNDRGRRDAPRMGQWLADQGLQPDLILTSSALRAQATVAEVTAAAGMGCPVLTLNELYLAAPQIYLEVLRRQPDHCQCILVVGHNPGLEELVAVLTGQHETLPTAALVQVQLDVDSWQQLATDHSAHCVGVWRPRDLA